MGICFIFRKPLLYLLERAVPHFRMQTHTSSIYLCGTVFVHDQSGDESVHQFSGIWENRNAHGNAWRIYQYCAGSDPDFRTGYGSTGSSPCNGDLPGLSAAWVMEVSDREEGDSSTLQKSNAIWSGSL